jgi:hypothetical protein
MDISGDNLLNFGSRGDQNIFATGSQVDFTKMFSNNNSWVGHSTYVRFNDSINIGVWKHAESFYPYGVSQNNCGWFGCRSLNVHNTLGHGPKYFGETHRFMFKVYKTDSPNVLEGSYANAIGKTIFKFMNHNSSSNDTYSIYYKPDVDNMTIWNSLPNNASIHTATFTLADKESKSWTLLSETSSSQVEYSDLQLPLSDDNHDYVYWIRAVNNTTGEFSEFLYLVPNEVSGSWEEND